jgi:DNA-binding NarL/FixJ family response regulator
LSIGDAGPVTLRCVIVDDSASFLEAARELLVQEGVEVVATAENSADAIPLVEKLSPDVTLVDVDLGDESGFDLAQRLSALGSNVILISTHAEEDLAQLIQASPALAFVSKTRLSAHAISEVLDRAA